MATEGQPSLLIIVFVFVTSLNFVFLQPSVTECPLDIQFSPPLNDSNCEAGGWGGFITNTCACGVAFDDYLYALGKHANQTGQLYLNSTDQKNCLSSMKSIDQDVFGCGIEKLTNGAGGCSDYTVKDVVNNLGKRLRNLEQDCEDLGSGSKRDQGCSACLSRWEEIDGSADDKIGLNFEANICRFAILVTLTGNKIDDKKWVQAVYGCLRVQNSSVANEDGGRASHFINTRTGLLIIIIGLVGIAVIVFIAIWTLFRKRTKENYSTKKEATAPHYSFSGESSCLQISTKEIYLATNNFNPSNFIGRGIAGEVYKGILSNGQHVAVKHIVNDGLGETFVREVTSLSHVRHPNLVALLGYCEHEDECFLVYELCHNGNLSEWLYSKERDLSWIQRLEIATDCARGLWFLHTYPEGCIVHRDIKPTNILISAEFRGKLSDFGLSKVMDVGQSHVSSEVRGTFGYVDPEYRRNHRVYASGDVYSFGVVLLQLLSGQSVINLNLKKPMPLNKMAKFLIRGGNVTEFADPKLNGEYSVEAFDIVLKLALSCTGPKQERPSMEQVVQRLERAVVISTQVNTFTSFDTPITD